MLKYNTVVIDDEKTNINLVKHIITNFLNDLNVIGEASTVEEGILTINEMNPDIVFLDVQLYEKNAFDILDNIDFSEIEVVLVTAYEDYAVKAFKYNVVDYVLKPILIEDLVLATNKCIRRIEEKKTFEKNLNLDHNGKNNINSKYISISALNKTSIIKQEDIVFCKSDGRYTTFYLKNKEELVASKNLGTFESILDGSTFFRIHHSYIVNIEYVVSIIKKTCYYCEMINNINLPVAKRRQESLNKFLKNRITL